VQISARSAISVIYLSVLLIHHSVSGMLKVLRFLWFYMLSSLWKLISLFMLLIIVILRVAIHFMHLTLISPCFMRLHNRPFTWSQSTI